MKRNYRLKNRKRFAAFIMVVALLSVFTGLMVNAGAASEVQDKPMVIKVEHGDTLWEIALSHKDGSDIREYIYQIKKLNQLEGDVIFAGQQLLLPNS